MYKDGFNNYGQPNSLNSTNTWASNANNPRAPSPTLYTPNTGDVASPGVKNGSGNQQQHSSANSSVADANSSLEQSLGINISPLQQSRQYFQQPYNNANNGYNPNVNNSFQNNQRQNNVLGGINGFTTESSSNSNGNLNGGFGGMYTANGGNINNGMNPIVNGSNFGQQNYFANHNVIGMGGYNSNNMRPDMVLPGNNGALRQQQQSLHFVNQMPFDGRGQNNTNAMPVQSKQQQHQQNIVSQRGQGRQQARRGDLGNNQQQAYGAIGRSGNNTSKNNGSINAVQQGQRRHQGNQSQQRTNRLPQQQRQQPQSQPQPRVANAWGGRSSAAQHIAANHNIKKWA